MQLHRARSVISTAMRWIAGTALLLTAVAAAGSYAVDRDLKATLEIDYCAEHRIMDGRNHEGRKDAAATLLAVRKSRRQSGPVPYGTAAVRMFAYPQISCPCSCTSRLPERVDAQAV